MADILVVADTAWVVNDVRAALSDGRTTIREIADPRAVVEAVKEQTPAVVVVDLQIGSMGGMAVTRAVRDAFPLGTASAPPVILMLDRDADAFLAGRSGAAAWVRKPFSSGELRAAVERLVPAP
ncbi:MAG: response regulator [Actinomycetota bacterium]